MNDRKPEAGEWTLQGDAVDWEQVKIIKGPLLEGERVTVVEKAPHFEQVVQEVVD